MPVRSFIQGGALCDGNVEMLYPIPSQPCMTVRVMKMQDANGIGGRRLVAVAVIVRGLMFSHHAGNLPAPFSKSLVSHYRGMGLNLPDNKR